ncbi:unnamed protein product [Medioppia subpectinata]|uniref:Peptidase S1 domain-containing protein n=1 Tax=Medioppia subpectinata TaxID=1979941 RepID=A0A7R9KMD7_9ACAR|nr:unnamed protein product [Medioppia subpectinata]CAG2106278.1 unnamed protein product [Medioppia subpectinata]
MTTSVNTNIDVKTTSGTVRGQTVSALDTELYQFLAIPYAEPPVGALRFAKPEPIKKARDSEDCLVLNIWTPTVPTDNTSKTSLKPVMFWLYGGGLSIGTIDMYNGGPLASHGVVFVAPNYRVNHFGFLYGDREDAPGNVGFYDQLLALKWITIFGESAGSWSVSAHILSPLSKGLFKRAIMQSGAHMYNKDRDVNSKAEAIAEGKRVAKELGCSEGADWVQYLRTVDAKDLVEKANPLTYPVLGTEFLPLSAHKALHNNQYNNDIDLMAGITSTEGSSLSKLFIAPDKEVFTIDDFVAAVKASDAMFHGIDAQKVVDHYLKGVDTSNTPALKRAFYEYFGDLFIKYPTYLFARQVATGAGDRHSVYFYELTHQNQFFAQILQCDTEESGIGHAMDIPFVFGMPFGGQMAAAFDETDRQFSRDVMRMWTNFAKYGVVGDGNPVIGTYVPEYGVNGDNCGYKYVTNVSEIQYKQCFRNYYKRTIYETVFGHKGNESCDSKPVYSSDASSRIYKGSEGDYLEAPWAVMLAMMSVEKHMINRTFSYQPLYPFNATAKHKHVSHVTHVKRMAYSCTGVLISEYVVLTAAHCLIPYLLKPYYVLSDSYQLWAHGGGMRGAAGRVIMEAPQEHWRPHPEYVAALRNKSGAYTVEYMKSYDVGLVRLKHPMRARTDHKLRYVVNTVCLPERSPDRSKFLDELWFYGYGVEQEVPMKWPKCVKKAMF